MKYRMTIECETTYLPRVVMVGSIADDLAREYLARATITELRVESIEPVVGDLIPIDQCDCVTTTSLP